MVRRSANERPFFEKNKQIQYVKLIKDAVYKFGSSDYLQLRDWSLDPEPLLDAQDMYHAATVEAYPDGEKVLRPFADLTPMMSRHLCTLATIS